MKKRLAVTLIIASFLTGALTGWGGFALADSRNGNRWTCERLYEDAIKATTNIAIEGIGQVMDSRGCWDIVHGRTQLPTPLPERFGPAVIVTPRNAQ